ncbi:Ornithine decarboxylase [Giardia muris]|uniref:ornithine decarboxylase n=1 Tax=Giardia muris TaxID=5742 RepID=A0A4Z1SNC9_GIAMU|nr:Ornithine decarboxylase [Giardia muris]|eukprot:TNJ26365.1 Ornithine decarboxylase [Giardia muris]
MLRLTRHALAEFGLRPIRPREDVGRLVAALHAETRCDSVCVLNVSVLEAQYRLWESCLPGVRPFYAIKCNPHPVILRALHLLGAGFDCASPAELRAALAAGCSPSDIIYANPQKTASSIRAAHALNCDLFTFDSEHELCTMLKNAPADRPGRYVLRLLPPDESASICKFGIKFGANPQEASRLLRLCRKLGANLVGLSFHVGSGCGSVDAFRLAVQYMGTVARQASELGFSLTLIDLGGGYMSRGSTKHYEVPNARAGITPPSFEEISSALLEELAKIRPHFAPDVRVIAEPGRFFSGDSMTLGVRVFGRRIVFSKEESEYAGETEEELLRAGAQVSEVKYYVGDGLYGSFNAIFFDHVVPHLTYVHGDGTPYETPYGPTYQSHIFGPTCDSLDCILADRPVPLLEVGDWVVIPAFGAYTLAAASEFNGIPRPTVVACLEE